MGAGAERIPEGTTLRRVVLSSPAPLLCYVSSKSSNPVPGEAARVLAEDCPEATVLDRNGLVRGGGELEGQRGGSGIGIVLPATTRYSQNG